MNLFEHSRLDQINREAPLAARMRPRSLEEFVGQEEIVGPGKLLRRAIETDRLFSSIVLWGPPGTGKTSLAMIISHITKSHFEVLSAVMAGVADIRRIVAEAKEGETSTVSVPFSSLMRSIGSTKRSRMPCCPTWKMGLSSS